MTTKKQIYQAIETLPNTQLTEALALIESLKTKPYTSAKSFLTHLKTIGSWAGEDMEECLETAQKSRGEAQFYEQPNPFE